MLKTVTIQITNGIIALIFESQVTYDYIINNYLTFVNQKNSLCIKYYHIKMTFKNILSFLLQHKQFLLQLMGQPQLH
jgi:hypothetical protein